MKEIRKTKVVFVAGGLATRLQPITNSTPKCLIDIKGKPLIEYQLRYYRDQGIKDFIFCVGHLGQKVEDYFQNGENWDVNIKYVYENGNNLLGTAGAVKQCEYLLDDKFIVHYGDVLCSLDVQKCLTFHNSYKGVATIILRNLPLNYQSSSLILLNRNYISTFKEKPTNDDFVINKAENKYINNGIYILENNLLDYIPSQIKSDFSHDIFPNLLSQGIKIKGYVSDSPYWEIGRLEKLKNFNNLYKNTEFKL